MTIMYSEGGDGFLFQLEKDEDSKSPWKYYFRSVTGGKAIQMSINKITLEKIRDAIDLEIGPKS